MRRRRLTIVMLVWSTLWFGAVLPGHQRGAVRLPDGQTGGDAAAADDAADCPLCVAADDADPDAPPADPARCCAVCQFRATLTPPPVVDFEPPTARLRAVLPWRGIDDRLVRLPARTPFSSRGPPLPG